MQSSQDEIKYKTFQPATEFLINLWILWLMHTVLPHCVGTWVFPRDFTDSPIHINRVIGSLPGAGHILAQPLKRRSASRIKPGWNVQTCKKDTKHSLFWDVRKKEFLYVVAELRAKSHKPWKSLCPTVLQLRWLISTWWDENVTLFVISACYKIHWNWFYGRNQTKAQRSKEKHFLGEGCFDRKEYISNTANKRCPRQVLQLRCSSWYSVKFYTWR